MEKLGLEDTAEGLDSVALSPLLAAGNFTVFAPVDGSFDVPDAEAIEVHIWSWDIHLIRNTFDSNIFANILRLSCLVYHDLFSKA